MTGTVSTQLTIEIDNLERRCRELRRAVRNQSVGTTAILLRAVAAEAAAAVKYLADATGERP